MKITDILSEEEQVETTANANMAPFFVPLGFAVALTVAGLIMTLNSALNSGIFALGIIAFVFAIAVLIFALTKLEYALSTKIYITNKRVILKSGVLKSVQSELPIDKISGVTVVEPLLGKLFHYGTVIVESSANVSGVRANYINRPYDFKKTLKIEQR